jgi:hypothetical protein
MTPAFLECPGGYGHLSPNPCEGVKQTNRPMYSKLVSDISRTIKCSNQPLAVSQYLLITSLSPTSGGG